MIRSLARVALAALTALAGSGCGAGGGASGAAASPAAVRAATGRPPVLAVDRDGDPAGAVAVAVSTRGVAPSRGAQVAVALAAVVDARLAPRASDVRVVPSFDGYRVTALVATDAEGAAFASAVRDALLSPIDAAAVTRATERLAALAKIPIADPALADAARCTGEVVALPDAPAPPDAAELEVWRQGAHALGRVAFATAGHDTLARAVAAALAEGRAWPDGALPPVSPPLSPRAAVYEAGRSIPAGSARATLVARTSSATRAVVAAEALGAPSGPLASRLRALDAPAVVRSVTATAQPDGGCIAAVIDMSARDLAVDVSGRIATAVALARQEIAVELSEAPADASSAGEIAARAGDPRDAADRAAWWSLSRDAKSATDIAVAIAFASGKDTEAADAAATRADQIRSELDRATVGWQAPVVESKKRIERGQGELWLLVGSPCGTTGEVDDDAGLGALVAVSAAEHARRLSIHDERVEPWATAAGIGLLVHAPALTGESPAAHARRLADVAARSFAADPLDDAAIADARAELLVAATSRAGRFAAALGGALSPGHPSLIAPLGTAEGIGRASPESIRLHASALRAGPIRVAVVANVDAAQADAAAKAADRWVARRPDATRACPAAAPAAAPRAGTYVAEPAGATIAEAALALPLPPSDITARVAAELVAAALDGADGLLAHALSGGLASDWSARVVGADVAAALVVRITATTAQLDAAVAQARALVDRVRQAGLGTDDLARAVRSRARAQLAAALDPGRRVESLWQGAPAPLDPPSVDAVRAFASQTLRDDALVIVAARPPRPPRAP